MEVFNIGVVKFKEEESKIPFVKASYHSTVPPTGGFALIEAVFPSQTVAVRTLGGLGKGVTVTVTWVLVLVQPVTVV